MKDMTRRFMAGIIHNSLIVPGDRILLSLSAGKDSMAMLSLFLEIEKEYKLTLGIFHLNHMVRGRESDMDEDFLRAIASDLGVEFHGYRHDFNARSTEGKSFEERARELRYSLLHETAMSQGYDRIATAHTLDDNAETILMRILSGTGIYGLRGIELKRGIIIRPLLAFRGWEIYRYLSLGGLSWREDSSNSDTAYLRNFLRNELMPAISPRFSDAAGALTSLSEIASDNVSMIDGIISEKNGTIYNEENGTFYFVEDLFTERPGIFVHILSSILRNEFGQFISRDIMREIFRRRRSLRANIVLYENRNIIIKRKFRDGKRIIVASKNPGKTLPMEWEYHLVIENGSVDPQRIKIPEAGLVLGCALCGRDYFNKNFTRNDHVFITLRDGPVSISIRNRRNGDRIRLKSGSKKIKNIFIEKKLDNETRNCVPLLLINNAVTAFMPGFVSDITNRVAHDSQVGESDEKILAIFKESL